MAKTYTPSLNVIIDTKEKTPWALEDPKVMSREYKSLKTGDYTLVGAEEYLCIERMNGVYLMRCLNRMQVRYGFNIIYAGNRYNAERIAINLMEDVATELRCQKLIS